MNAIEIKQLVDAYQPSVEAMERLSSIKNILIIAGISGAGKDTVINELFKQEYYARMVTTTTRKPRINQGVLEQHGVEYNFISKDDFLEKMQAKEFFEVNMFGENLYGTTVEGILQATNTKKIVVFDVDINGVENFTRCMPMIATVFLVPPSYEVWQERFKKRYEGQMINQEDFASRMHIAKHELERVMRIPYLTFVVNDNLQETVDIITTILKVNALSGGVDDTHARSIARDIANRL